MDRIEKLLKEREHRLDVWLWASMRKEKTERDLRAIEEQIKHARAEQQKDGAA